MPAVQRVGDKNSASGAIQQGESSVTVNGIAISVTNNPVSPHPGGGPHTNARTNASQSSVTVNGKPVVITGDKDTCGHARVGGSPNVTIG